MQQRILIIQYSANRDGSALSALSLANGLRDAGYRTMVAFGFCGPMVDEFAAAGHEPRVIPHKNWLRSTSYLRSARNAIRELLRLRAFRQLYRAASPDLIYINTAVSLAAAFAAKVERLPVVWHLRELSSDVGGELVLPHGMKRWLSGAFEALAHRIVVNSRAVAGDVLADDVNVEVVPNAVADYFFEDKRRPSAAREILGLPDAGPILGVPGTIRPMKGHSFLIESLPHVVDAFPELTVAITGDSSTLYAGEIHKLVREMHLSCQVVFLGSISDMSAFYRACDVVCIPSRAEPFGRTVIEAMAAGTPVVASAVGGIVDIVEDGRTGILVQYGNTRELAQTVCKLLEDGSLRAYLAEQGRMTAEVLYRESEYQRLTRRIVDSVASFSNLH